MREHPAEQVARAGGLAAPRMRGTRGKGKLKILVVAHKRVGECRRRLERHDLILHAVDDQQVILEICRKALGDIQKHLWVGLRAAHYGDIVGTAEMGRQGCGRVEQPRYFQQRIDGQGAVIAAAPVPAS